MQISISEERASRSALQNDRKRADLTAYVKALARQLGFSDCRMTRPDGHEEAGRHLGEFLDLGRHGSMDWMNEKRDWRADASKLWPEARSVVMFAMNYGPDEDPMPLLGKKQA